MIRQPRSITAEQFNALPAGTRMSYLWDHCVFIDERIDNNRYVVKLYAVHDFYAEVVFDMKNTESYPCHALTDAEVDELLEKIDLRDLYGMFELDGQRKSFKKPKKPRHDKKK